MFSVCSKGLYVKVFCHDHKIFKGYYEGDKEINGINYVVLKRLDGIDYVPIDDIKIVRMERPELLLIEGKR